MSRVGESDSPREFRSGGSLWPKHSFSGLRDPRDRLNNLLKAHFISLSKRGEVQIESDGEPVSRLVGQNTPNILFGIRRNIAVSTYSIFRLGIRDRELKRDDRVS